MARSVSCSIVDMPDGHFGVVAGLASRKIFRRVGLPTLAEADECVEFLRHLGRLRCAGHPRAGRPGIERVAAGDHAAHRGPRLGRRAVAQRFALRPAERSCSARCRRTGGHARLV